MNEGYSYPGDELALFAQARNWKKYFSGTIRPFIMGNVLEVGAGIGATTPYLLNKEVRSWTMLEPDRMLCIQIEKKLDQQQLPSNCKSICGDLRSLDPQQQYDTILYIDVLEHLQDDQGELRRAVEWMKPRGRLIVLSPAHQSLFSKFDHSIGHLRRYEKGSIRNIVDNSKLKEEHLFYLDSMGCLSSLANKWMLKQSMPTLKQIHFWDTKLIPISRVTDKLFGLTIGKTIIGIWRKND
jgi:cyclopropane fatty-acyl-phospholipid synthase-like methyltransferase